MPKIKSINHVAVVVDDMDKALSFWRDALGMDLHELRQVPAESSQVAFLPLAGSEVELVKPTTDDSGIARESDSRVGGSIQLKSEDGENSVRRTVVGVDMQAFSNSGGLVIAGNTGEGNLTVQVELTPADRWHQHPG